MMYQQVKEFRQKMALPIGKQPQLLTPEQTSYFARFIMEELSEYLRGVEEGSIVDAADALADLVYVTLGMAHAMGLPFETLFNIVHEANMQKEPASDRIRSLRGQQYDVVKPVGWENPEPKIERLLRAHGANI